MPKLRQGVQMSFQLPARTFARARAQWVSGLRHGHGHGTWARARARYSGEGTGTTSLMGSSLCAKKHLPGTSACCGHTIHDAATPEPFEFGQWTSAELQQTLIGERQWH
jgi:hypothetical protein